MATAKKAKKVSMSTEELKVTDALAAFVKQHEGKTLTDAQKAQKKALVEALGKLKFLRIANKRLPRTLSAIKAIANLSGKQYVKTEAQITAIVGALEGAVKDVKNALSGTKESKTGFVLPGFDEGEKK